MAQITLIEPQKNDKQRCNIYIDGRFYCGMKLEVVVKYRLKVGMPIDEDTLAEIQLETEKSQALDRALNYISATMKTKRQIRDYLAKKGYITAVSDYVIERLEYYGYADDYAYCRMYASSVTGKGKRALECDLIKRGAERNAIEAALSEIEEDGETVKALLVKYMRGKENTRENLNKGLKYLMSKGFGYEIAKSAVESYGGVDEDY